MSKFERGYVPLPEAVTSEVRFNLELPPFINPNQIGVNLKNIHGLARFAGIKTVHVVNAEEERTYRGYPPVVGVEISGAAHAGKAKTKSVELFRVQSASDSQALLFPARWSDLTIEVDTNQVAEAINSKREKGGVTTPEVWAKQLNGVLKKAIKQEGVKNLTVNCSDADIFLTSAGHLIALMAAAPLHDKPLMFIAAYEAIMVMANIAYYRNIWENNSLSPEGYRPSLIFGPQLDRTILLSPHAKLRTLVKSIKSRE